MRSLVLLLLPFALFACGGSEPGLTGGGGSSPSSSTGATGAGATSSGATGGGNTGVCNTAAECGATEYCSWHNLVCKDRGTPHEDAPGACAPRDENCIDAGAGGPVCGCDGNTYPSRCDANTAGIDVQNEGGCPPPQGTFACGFGFCTIDVEVCVSLLVDGNDQGPDGHQCVSPEACSPAACDCLGPIIGSECTCAPTNDGGIAVDCIAI